MNRALSHKQRGVAVITALLLTTLAITIVASLFWQQQVQVRAIENQRLQLQKEWILRGALDWASLILREDAKHSGMVDNLDEPWAVPLAETRLDEYVDNSNADADVADAILSGNISDAQARYNLTNLSFNGVIDPAEVMVFNRLLKHASIDPALAQATAELMASTQNKPEVVTAEIGAQPAAQPIKLTQLEDLLAVPGFTPAMLGKLKDFVIFLPLPTPVNVNTASAEVLAARIGSISIIDATSLVTKRSAVSFRDISDFRSQLPDQTQSATSNEISVETKYFLIDGRIRMGRTALRVQALIDRSAGGAKLLWMREY